jgi:hypothetical protein
MDLEIGEMPDGHVVVGYIASLKMLDEEGTIYWAMRNDGLNSMESLGMASDLHNEYRVQLEQTKTHPGEDS